MSCWIIGTHSGGLQLPRALHRLKLHPVRLGNLLQEQGVDLGTWLLLLLFQGLGKHPLSEAQGKFFLLPELPLALQEVPEEDHQSCAHI